MGLLDGKVAIVTGAGRGIGREEALLLAGEGATVIVNDVGASLHGEGGDVHPAQEVVDIITPPAATAAVNGDDISSWAGGKNVVDQAVDTYGRLDILVNNAGILRDKMSFNMEESDWDDVIRVHLKGHFAPSHFAAVYWRNKAKAGEEVSGRIINTSSEAGLYGNAGQANYSAAKAGIAAMTWVLARELGRYGVTVNAIAPRARTRMTENLFGEMAAKKDEGFDEWDPANIAKLVAFLASDEAADVNGQVFVVFGGERLGHERLPAGRRDPPRRRLDAVRAGGGQGRAVQGHRLGHPQVLLLLGRLRTRPGWRRRRHQHHAGRVRSGRRRRRAAGAAGAAGVRSRRGGRGWATPGPGPGGAPPEAMGQHVAMAHPRRFRFAAQLGTSPGGTGPAWAEQARRAEDLGYSTLLMPDHFGDQLAPVPAIDGGGRRHHLAAGGRAGVRQRLPPPARPGQGDGHRRPALRRAARAEPGRRAGCAATTSRPASPTTRRRSGWTGSRRRCRC